jgi:hypothetical protein
MNRYLITGCKADAVLAAACTKRTWLPLGESAPVGRLIVVIPIVPEGPPGAGAWAGRSYVTFCCDQTRVSCCYTGLETMDGRNLSSQPLPSLSNIWEASRFGCDHTVKPVLRRRIVAAVICGCLEFGIEFGVDRYLSVMPLAILGM